MIGCSSKAHPDLEPSSRTEVGDKNIRIEECCSFAHKAPSLLSFFPDGGDFVDGSEPERVEQKAPLLHPEKLCFTIVRVTTVTISVSPMRQMNAQARLRRLHKIFRLWHRWVRAWL